MADQNNKNNKPEGNQLSIELPEAIADGLYSNLAVITHSPTEFILDFIQIVPNVPKAKVKSRILLGPQNAKRLLRALAENVKKYESQFGTIQEPDAAKTGFPPMSFNAPTGQA